MGQCMGYTHSHTRPCTQLAPAMGPTLPLYITSWGRARYSVHKVVVTTFAGACIQDSLCNVRNNPMLLPVSSTTSVLNAIFPKKTSVLQCTYCLFIVNLYADSPMITDADW